MFVYWFRYICLLVLQNGSNVAVAHRVAQTIRLSFPRVRDSLDGVPTAGLDELFTALEQDYRTLNDLLPQAQGSTSIERRLLDLDFQLMRVTYRVGRALGIPIGRTALKEMSSILNFYATAVGQ